MLSPLSRRRDERGSILVLSTVGLVLALIGVGLSVDLGGVAQEARRNQKVADLAALDAARAPAGYQAAATAAASRNLFPTGPGYSVTAIEGVKVNGSCVAQAGAGSVCVTVTSPHKNAFPFTTGLDSVSRSAMAGAANAIGKVRVGSTVASANGNISPMQDTILDKTISSLIGGSYSTNAVGWQGLASGDVTFAALSTALAAATGNATFNVGTTDEVMRSTFTAAQLFTATADALNRSGNSSVATDVTGIKNQINANGTYLDQTFTLYDLFNFGSVVIGNKEDVANMNLNVLELIKGGAIVANGDKFAAFNLTASDVSNATGVPIPFFNNVKVNLGLIEAPQWAVGPPGKDAGDVYYTTASTSQIRVRLDVDLKIPLSQPIKVGLVTVLNAGALVDAKMSYYLDGGSGHASLHELHCGTSSEPTSVDIWGTTDVTKSRAGFVSNARLSDDSVIPLPTVDPVAGMPLVLSIAGLLNVRLNGVVSAAEVPGNEGEMKIFSPPYTDSSPSQPISGTMLALPNLATANLTLDPLVALLNVGDLLPTLVSGINGTGTTFNTNTVGLTTSVLKPLYDALGLSFGGADIWAPPVQTCGALSPMPTQVNSTPVLKG